MNSTKVLLYSLVSFLFSTAMFTANYLAYAILGPMLKQYKEGNKQAFSAEKWNEVRDFRFKVPKDLEALKMQARDQVVAGDHDIELDFPEYPVFSWDTEAQ